MTPEHKQKIRDRANNYWQNKPRFYVKKLPPKKVIVIAKYKGKEEKLTFTGESDIEAVRNALTGLLHFFQ